MKCILNNIVALDLLTSPPQLKVNKNTAYKTLIGGFLTIIIYCLTVIGISYFGSELFLKNEPFVVSSDKDFDKVGPFNIKVDSFYFYIAVQDIDYFFFSDPTIFELSAIYQLWWYENGQQNSLYNPVEISLCNKYFNNTSELHLKRDLIDLNKFYCVKPNTYSIEGFWGGLINGFISIELNKCFNTTQNNNHCKSQDIIDSKIEGGQINIIAETYNMHYNNYDNPVVKSYKDIYYSINNDFTINMFISLQSLNFENDGGFIPQNIELVSTYYIEDPLVLYYGNRGNLLARVDIQGLPLGKQIKRSYSKFQDVLTKIGGLLKSFSVIGSFIAKLVSRVQFYNDYLFNLSTRDNEIQKKLPSPKKKLEIIRNINNQTQNKSNLNLHKQKIEDLNSIVVYNFSHISINKSKELYLFKNQIKDFLLQSLICYKSDIRARKKLLLRKINHVLSIESILEKFYMVEVLQHYLLTDYENALSNRFYYDIMTNKENTKSLINSKEFNNESIFKLNKTKLDLYFKAGSD